MRQVKWSWTHFYNKNGTHFVKNKPKTNKNKKYKSITAVFPIRKEMYYIKIQKKNRLQTFGSSTISRICQDVYCCYFHRHYDLWILCLWMFEFQFAMEKEIFSFFCYHFDFDNNTNYSNWVVGIQWCYSKLQSFMINVCISYV